MLEKEWYYQHNEGWSNCMAIGQSFVVCITSKQLEGNNIYNNYLIQLSLSGKEINKVLLPSGTNYMYNKVVISENNQLLVFYNRPNDLTDEQDHLLLIYDEQLVLQKTVELTHSTVKVYTHNEKIIRFASDKMGICYQRLDMDGNMEEDKYLLIDPKFSNTDYYSIQKDGTIIIASTFLMETSLMKKMNYDEYDNEEDLIQDFFANELADMKNNKPTCLFVLKFDHLGTLLYEHYLPRKNYDGGPFVDCNEQGDVILGTYNQFLQDDKEHFEFIKLNAQKEQVLSLPFQYTDDFRRYQGALTPNLNFDTSGKYIFHVKGIEGCAFQVCVSDENFKELDYATITTDSQPTYEVIRNEKNELFVLTWKGLYKISFQSN